MQGSRLRLSRLALTLVVGLLGLPAAQALGLGSVEHSPVLGQPLDLSVSVRLDQGEALDTACVQAQVFAGDDRLPDSEIRVGVEASDGNQARVRVRTLMALTEPVLEVRLAVGCGTSVNRRYVLLPDPPDWSRSAGSGLVPPAPQALAPARVAPGPAGTASAPAFESAATAAAVTAAVAATPALAAPPRAAATRGEPAAASRRAGASRQTPSTAAAARSNRSERSTARAPGPPKPTPAPRLRLDPMEARPAAVAATAASTATIALSEALAAAAEAASAARSAALAASAATGRVTELEHTVAQLRAENAAAGAQLQTLRSQLAAIDHGSPWIWPLLALVLALAGLAGWLALRLGALERRKGQDWSGLMAAQAPQVAQDGSIASRAPADEPPPAPTPVVAEAVSVVTEEVSATVSLRKEVLARLQSLSGEGTRAGATLTAPAALFAAGNSAPGVEAPRPTDADPGPSAQALRRQLDEEDAEPATRRTQLLGPESAGQAHRVREASIEELIDLEQQADFFIVLGQEEAAADLLVEHMRVTGGSSALPYLKLLEIHHRLGDRDAYERMRTRFHQRFNAYAPRWGEDPNQGRTLEDYPDIVSRLQQCWDRPLDAMAELEALLFRKSSGELFDLPAYRDVLQLYALARERFVQDSGQGDSVDVLLPLEAADAFSDTSQAPLLPESTTTPPPAGSAKAYRVSTASLELPPLHLELLSKEPPVDLDLSGDDGPPAPPR